MIIQHRNRKAIIKYIVCPNPECKEFSLFFDLQETRYENPWGWKTQDLIKTWNLIPQFQVKPLPGYIPKPTISSKKVAVPVD
ncbi:MAG: hypothetical protein RIN55_07580 [Tissierellaceae bacterium]|nr:hypothetical protein [Tissierellaceae bacterium]